MVSSVEKSSALKSWLVLADSMGVNGRKTLVNLLTKVISDSKSDF
jgi:hypothetical protein